MICTCCAREVVGVLLGGSNLTGGACPQCVELADAMQAVWDAMQALWDVLPQDERPAGLASACGHVMRVTIECSVPN